MISQTDFFKKKFAIKRQVLYKEYEKGGLKMLNFDCLQKSQRIMWIKRFVNDPNSSWAKVFNSFFSMYGSFELFIRCNYKVNLLSKNIPLYYRTMLHNWNGIKCNEYMDNFVWNNCDILSDKKTIYSSRLFKCGLWYLSDLFCNNELVPFDIWLERGCIKADFLTWLQIVNSVKKKGLYAGYDTKPDIYFFVDDKIYELYKAANRIVYGKCLAEVTGDVCSKHISDIAVNYQISPDEWKKIFTLSTLYTINRKMREFQYKLLNGAVYLNVHLSKWKIGQTELCIFCNEQCETYEHLFFKCRITINIWKEIIKLSIFLIAI